MRPLIKVDEEPHRVRILHSAVILAWIIHRGERRDRREARGIETVRSPITYRLFGIEWVWRCCNFFSDNTLHC